jgi:hypothetical protein
VADRAIARPRKLAASLAAVAAIAFATPYAAAVGRADRTGDQLAQVERGLAWMRAGTASPGSFNHPGAELDWCVLAPAELGPLVLYHARRPAALAALGARTSARESELAAILAASDDGAFVRWLDRERARFVVAVPQLVRDARLGGGGSADPRSLAARLALPRTPSGESAIEGLALAYAASDWRTPDGRAAEETAPGAGPSITIWRRTESASAGLEVEVEVGPVK